MNVDADAGFSSMPLAPSRARGQAPDVVLEGDAGPGSRAPGDEPADAEGEPERLRVNLALERALGWSEILKLERSIFDLHRYYQENKLSMDRALRRDLVWTNEMQSQVVESVLLRLPLPAVYLRESRDGRWQIIDGLQRLTTLFRFMENKLRLEGLRLLPDSIGRTIRDLDARLRRRFEDTSLTTLIVRSDSDERLERELFLRLNQRAPR